MTDVARRTFTKCALLWPAFAASTLQAKDESAFEALAKRIKSDYGYAWSWHCNLACSMMDTGITRDKVNKAAARFMRTAFGVDTSNGP